MPRRSLLSALYCFLFATFSFAQQQVTFSHSTFNGAPSAARVAVDLNNDGNTDVVSVGPGVNSVFVLLSGGDGHFNTAVEYPVGKTLRDVTAADVDGDGNADVVVAVLDSTFKGVAVLYGKGDGTLSAPVFYKSTDIIPDRAIVADFNGDGKKDILIIGGFSGDGNYYARLFTNTGSRTFSYGGGIQISNDDSCCDFTAIGIGDFDGDGHADFFVQRDHQANGPNTTIDLYTFFGDGAGHFTAGPSKTFNGNLSLAAADLNSDGKTDIVGTLAIADFDTGASTSTAFSFYGNAGRTLIETDLFTFPGSSPRVQVADFNGDGSNDIAFSGDDGVSPGIWLGLQQNGAFTIEKTAYNLIADLVGDFNHDGRADIAQLEGSTLEILYNETSDSSGNFNFCGTPVHGISVCSPANGSTITINSPNVTFAIGAADFSPIRKLEVWEGSTKLIQQFYGYFDYSFLNASKTMSAGTHTVTVVATGYDHTQIKKSVTFTVGSSTPPPVGCSAPSSGIHVCSPANNATLPAGSIHFQATGVAGTSKTELWVDGVKKASVSGNVLNLNSTLGTKGKRRVDFFSDNSAGQHIAQATVFITIN